MPLGHPLSSRTLPYGPWMAKAQVENEALPRRRDAPRGTAGPRPTVLSPATILRRPRPHCDLELAPCGCPGLLCFAPQAPPRRAISSSTTPGAPPAISFATTPGASPLALGLGASAGAHPGPERLPSTPGASIPPSRQCRPAVDGRRSARVPPLLCV